MTTDYTSGTINQNIKSTALEGRTFKAANVSQETGAFESVFENVSKNYADKSEVKNSKTTKNYAKATKNLNSTDKAGKSTADNKKDSDILNNTSNNQKVNNQAEKEKIHNKQQSNKINQKSAETFNTAKDNNLNNRVETQNKAALTETSSFEAKSEQFVPDESAIAQKELFERAEEPVFKETTVIIENTAEELSATPKTVETTVSAQELTDEEVANEPAGNEQLSAEIVYEQVALEAAVVPVQNEIRQEIADYTTEEEPVLIDNTADTAKEAPVNTNVQKENSLEENLLENTAKELLKDIQNSFPQETFTQNKLKNVLQSNIIQESIQPEVVETVQKQTAIEIATTNDNLEVDTQNLKPQKTFVQSADESKAQQNIISSDKTVLNIEETATLVEENTVLTPDKTAAEVVDESLTPMVQVTDEVALSIKNYSENVQNKDFAGKVKDKITAKLGDLLGTSTVVTEVQNNSQSLETGLNSNSQGNTSLSQGNAAEQTIRMSVESNFDSEVSPESFISRLEAKLGTEAKPTLSKSSETLNKVDIMNQINSKFSELNQGSQNKVSIILRPENLGRISVEIMNSGEGIIAKMTTDNQQVRELLDRNIEALRANLSNQGVNVNNIKVECSNQAENQTMDFARQQFEQSGQDFQGNGNHHANNSNQSKETAFWDNLSSPEDLEETAEQTDTTEPAKAEVTKTIITQNGKKIDYKV